MGASLQKEVDALPDATNQAKIFRLLRAEYFRLVESGVEESDLLPKLRLAYNEFVSATKAPARWRCPTRRFGRTEIQMPIITCGGMRQQQTWHPIAGTTMLDINKECQQNFEAIVDRSMALGINHFETALSYGTSQLQYGAALSKYDRSSYILQTKIVPNKDPAAFREFLENSLNLLQVEYIDLLTFHGLVQKHLDWIFCPGGCMEVIDEFRKLGKVRWIGFSSHSDASMIVEAINSRKFDFVNLHYHFIGSYTSSGTLRDNNLVPSRGHMFDPAGNYAAIRAASKHDMGVFIISPNDKGGMLYKPSRTLTNICRDGGLTPIAFNALWLWSHNGLDQSIHTLVIGVARPTDFDEMVHAAELLPRAPELIKNIETKIQKLMVDKLGEHWIHSWWKGLPTPFDTPTGIFFGHIVWLHNLTTVLGMWEYARARYSSLESNAKNWKKENSLQKNLDSMNIWTPGMPVDPEIDLSPYLRDCPNCDRILAILKEAHEWFCAENEQMMKSQLENRGWLTSYDLQTDCPFPER